MPRICPTHGTKDAFDTYCDECGLKMRYESSENQLSCKLCDRTMTRLDPKAKAKMKFCYNCGFRYGRKVTLWDRLRYNFELPPSTEKAVDNSGLDRTPEKK